MSELTKEEQALIDHDMAVGDFDQEDLKGLEKLNSQRDALVEAADLADAVAFMPPLGEEELPPAGSDVKGAKLEIFKGVSDGTYDGTLKFLSNTKPRKTVKVDELADNGRYKLTKDKQSWRWSGWVYTEVEQPIDISTTSDDYSFVVIDGRLVLDCGGFHGALTKKKSMVLQPGWHTIVLNYGEGTGDAVMDFSIKPDLAVFLDKSDVDLKTK